MKIGKCTQTNTHTHMHTTKQLS